MNRFKMLFTTKLAVGILALSVVGLITIYIIVNTVVHNIISDNVITIAQREQAMHASEIEAWFDAAYQNLENLGIVLSAMTNVEDYLPVIEDFAKAYDYIGNIFVGYTNGETINAIGWIPEEGWSLFDRPWYHAALAAGEGEIARIDPFWSHSGGHVALGLSIYLPTLNGIGAVVGFSITLDAILDKVSQFSVLGGGYQILIADDGRVIVHPRPYYSMGAGAEAINLRDIENGEYIYNKLNSGVYYSQIDDATLGRSYFIAAHLSHLNLILISIISTEVTQTLINNNLAIIMATFAIFLVVLSAVTLIIISFLARSLETAVQKAHIASLAKSEFLANMSHEIRTPMNSIIGFTELALDKTISGEIKDYLTKIMSSAKWLLVIINDILDISKIESRKLELESITFDIGEIFTDCRSLIIPGANEKGLTLYFYAEPSVDYMLIGDPARLRQVLINLLSNAVKFTNKGMIKVLADIKAKTNDSLTMYFEVKDSGIGMTPEQIRRVFDPFTQAESGTTRKYGGTGLGLSITKKLIELMGGKLLVESTPGVGSRFSFYLTFKTTAPDSKAVSPAAAFSVSEKPVFEGEILLCEDNVLNQQVISEHLARVGLKTVIAANGQIGIDMVKRRIKSGAKQFDLIFMDMHMPVMDGLEASEIINELNVGIPIVAVTANVMAGDREVYRQYGLHECVSKPFLTQDLWNCLMKYLSPVRMQPIDELMQGRSDEALQNSLIRDFYRQNKNKTEELNNAIKTGNIKLAHRLAHTLKSSAGQINKTLLQEAARDVENALKNGSNRVASQQMEKLEMELDAVLLELAPLAEELSLQEKASAVNFYETNYSKKLLDDLLPLLESGDAKCYEFLDELRHVPGSEELIKQIQDFHLKEAVITLVKLKNEL
ncbi:MAG: ATP-binding protein [Oscillospiraceae bacterium]|nr:ATP-binding protein [Oscillospiraceae bacterium]